MKEMEFGDMKKQLKKEIKRMKRSMKDGRDDSYMEETLPPMLALTYIIMMIVATEVLREQLLHGIMKTTMMIGRLGDYGSEEAEAEDYYEEEVESMTLIFKVILNI